MKWIDIKDEKPTKDGLAIMLAPSADPDKPLIMLAWYDPKKDFWTGHPIGFKVTHWMALPEAPK